MPTPECITPTPDYRQTVRELSDRLVTAQRPIRVLDAIKWSAAVEEAFFAAGAREQPRVDREYYARQPLGFDPAAKRQELEELEREVAHRLGQYNPVGQIMRRICREYASVVRMLEGRGTPEFCRLSQELYGSSTDALHAGDPNLADLGVMMAEALANIDRGHYFAAEEKNLTGEEAVAVLGRRVAEAFADVDAGVRVVLSDGIVADAAAGADTIKVRKEARFNDRDLRLLEVHEGWVHLGTTLNGASQPYCTFLSKGPPSATVTQEGLAIFLEIITFTSHPGRVRRVTNRIRAVHMAEEGASFLDVYGFFRGQGFSERVSFADASRVFRGSTPTGGAFTKDLSYSKGFLLIYNYIRLAVRQGKLDRIPLLFCGKTTLEDLRVLAQLVEEGLVTKPAFLPPQLRDLNALAAWMCYSNFLNRLSLDRVAADYAGIL
jgi:uncharacterized protein (TIGR02421 family)